MDASLTRKTRINRTKKTVRDDSKRKMMISTSPKNIKEDQIKLPHAQ